MLGEYVVRGKGKLIMQNSEHELLCLCNAEEEERRLVIQLTEKNSTSTNIDTVRA